MNLFMTGATGYLGSVVAEKLLGRGDRLVGLARSAAAQTQLTEQGIAAVAAQLDEPEKLMQAAAGAEAVIWAAAHLGLQQADNPPQLVRTAVAALLAGLGKSGKIFVFTSTVAVYGDTGEQVAAEDAPTAGRNPFTACLSEIEQMILRAPGVRGVVIRPGLIYGRAGGQGVLSQVRAARQAGAGLFVGSGESRVSGVHVHDLAELYRLALNQAPAGALLNGASGEPVTRRAIAEGASCAAGLGGITRSVSPEEARRVFGPAAVLMTINQVASGERAQRLLGWRAQAPTLLWELRHGSYAEGQHAQRQA